MLKTLTALGAVLCLSGAAFAQSTIVYGNSPAAQCYQDALAARTDRNALNACNVALEAEAMSRQTRAKTLVNRAVVHLHMRNPDIALADLRASEALGFEAPELYQNFSVAFLRLDRPQEAIDAATRAIELGLPARHYALYNRAVANEVLDNIHAAYADYRAASELAPDWPLPRRQLERFTVHGS